MVNDEIPIDSPQQDDLNNSNDDSSSTRNDRLLSIVGEIVDENERYKIAMSEQKRSYEQKLTQLTKEVTELKRQNEMDQDKLKEMGTKLEAAQSKLRKISSISQVSV